MLTINFNIEDEHLPPQLVEKVAAHGKSEDLLMKEFWADLLAESDALDLVYFRGKPLIEYAPD